MGATAYAGVVKSVTLLIICIVSSSIRLFSVVKYESVIHGVFQCFPTVVFRAPGRTRHCLNFCRI